MQISDYPGAIAQLQYQLLNLNQQIEKFSQSINRICNQFEMQIAFDPELKNDQQRKAKKTELIRQSGDYESLSSALAKETFKRSQIEIQLEQLKSEFAVLRLIKREAIAKLEASTEIGV
jgi:chromosome segregation ATPase